MTALGLEIENGWFLSLLYLGISYIPVLFARAGAKRAINYSFLSVGGKAIKAISIILSLAFIILLAYPVFLKIQFGSVFFMAGVVLFFLSSFGVIGSYISYFSTPLNEAIRKGTYRFSRNPIAISASGMILGMSLMLHSVFMFGLLLFYNILQHFVILEEERFCRNTYGDVYQEYFQKVPRYLLF